MTYDQDAWGLRAQIRAKRIARERFWRDVQIMAAGAFGATVLCVGSLFVWVAVR